eukprot:scaffold1976_cov187-Alexandrium_tamarense.AAC.5
MSAKVILLSTFVVGYSLGFAPIQPCHRHSRSSTCSLAPRQTRSPHPLLPRYSSPDDDIVEAVIIESSSSSDETDIAIVEEELTAEQKEKIGNLVADEEWAGLSMELAEVVRTAVVEDLKKNSRDFLNKDDYAVGDFSKEIDRRVKEEVAKMRDKPEYELGDFSVVLDGKVKELVCELSGKETYEFGDLSTVIDTKVKESVAAFCGKDSYQPGDLSKELAKRTKNGVLAFTGKDDYKFGDVTKKLIKNVTGDDYKFGDVTKKLMGNLFGGDKTNDLRLEVEEFNKEQWHSSSSESWSAQCNSLCEQALKNAVTRSIPQTVHSFRKARSFPSSRYNYH